MRQAQPITTVYVACYYRDYWMARACVASVRYYYPDIEIVLIKDTAARDFDTSELERAWSVQSLATPGRAFGWGFVHLETFFLPCRGRYLYLDCDTVLLGPVLDELERDPADFIVAVDQHAPTTLVMSDEQRAWMYANYYHPTRISGFDPEFHYPGYLFNGGQFVGTPAIFGRNDLDTLVEWREPPTVRNLDVFARSDQGILNYFLTKQASLGRIKLSARPLMHWPGWPGTEVFDVGRIAARRETPKILHWAGRGTNDARRLPRADIFRFFERSYYTRVPRGRAKYWARSLGQSGAERVVQILRLGRRLVPGAARRRLKKIVYGWAARIAG